MQQTSGDHSDARPWTVTVVVGLTAVLAATRFFGMIAAMRPASPGMAASTIPWFDSAIVIAMYAVPATGVWFRRQWARIWMLLLSGLNTAASVSAMANTDEATLARCAWAAAAASTVVLLLLPITHRWFRDGRTSAHAGDSPTTLVIPPEQMDRLGFLVLLGGIATFIANWSRKPGLSGWIVVAIVLAPIAFVILGLAFRRNAVIDTARRRLVLKHRSPVRAWMDHAFPLNRFGAVRTALSRGTYGKVRYRLELVTIDGGRCVTLTGGDAKDRKGGASDAALEPDAIASLRSVIARRIGITDSGCVGFEPTLPTLSRRDGERP